MQLRITALPGDGVGPEVTREAVRVVERIAEIFGHELRVQWKDVGTVAILACGDPLPPDTLQRCLESDAVLLGAVGAPAQGVRAAAVRPEQGLLRLRQELGVFANLRPATCYRPLEDCSPLKSDIVSGTDILIVRELLGGLYFGERSTSGTSGSRVAIDTMRYTEGEIERITRMAFELARTRRNKVASVDKANVLDCSRLWRDVVTDVSRGYPDMSLNHLYVDAAAMALVTRPRDFDVIVTENMFGDILSDQAGSIAGSIGMLPSASIGGSLSLYEPVHGSAPDIAGRGIANPVGSILSIAMMLRHSFRLNFEADCIDAAVIQVLTAGLRTRDIAVGGQSPVSTRELGDAVLEAIGEPADRQAQAVASRAEN